MRGLSLVMASGGHSSLRCAGLSLSRPLLLRSTSSRRAGSVVVAHGPSCSTACGIFPDRAQTRVPCIGRQTLNHCTTRETLISSLIASEFEVFLSKTFSIPNIIFKFSLTFFMYFCDYIFKSHLNFDPSALCVCIRCEV